MAKQTGTDTETGLITYYDPDKGRYGVVEHNADDPFAHKDDYEWTMVDGQRTYTKKSDTPSKTVPVGDNHFDKVYAGTPGYEDIEDPFAGYTGDRYNPTGGINREAGPAPADQTQGYTPVDLTPGYNPPQWDAGDTNSEAGTVTPGIPGDGGIVRDPIGDDGFPIRPTVGGGGSTGPDPFGPPDAGYQGAIERIGWGASDNRDFYREQFAQMRERDQAERGSAAAAAIRAQDNQDAGPAEAYDPWEYFGGSEQFTPTMGDGQTNTGEWQVNDSYGWIPGETTNADVIRSLIGKDVFTTNYDYDGPEDEGNFGAEYLNQLIKDQPWMEEQTGLLTNFSGPAEYLAQLSPDLAAKNKAVMRDVANNIWTQGTPGPTTPVDYASPV